MSAEAVEERQPVRAAAVVEGPKSDDFRVFRFRDLWVLLGLVVFIALLVGIEDALTMPPSLVDDIQIYRLDREMAESGFVAVAQDHIGDRFERLGRFVPAFLTYKLVAVKLFGTQLALWTASGLLIGALGAFLLYLSGRAMRLTVAEALYLSLITVLGEQSVIWWRLLQGEAIGMLFLALGIFGLARGAYAGRRRVVWDLLAFGSIVLATLSKESFILTIPALCFLRVWLETESGRGYAESLRRNLTLCAALLVVALAEILFIVLVIEETYFYYTGWEGFDTKDFVTTALEFFAGYRLWMLLAVPFIALIAALSATSFLAGAHPAVRRLQRSIGGLAVLAGLLIVPQLLLYMSSGFFSGPETHNMSRYLVPATLGIGLLAALSLRTLRGTSPQLFPEFRAARFGEQLRGLAHAAIAVPLFMQAGVAELEADRFYDYREEVGDLLELITEKTQPEDVLVFAYDEATARSTQRLSILLEGYSNRRNLYYVPIMWKRSEGADPLEWFEHDDYADQVEERTLMDPAALGLVKAFIIPDGSRAESAAIVQNLHWFDPAAYERLPVESGHVIYVASVASEPTDRSLSTNIQLSSWWLNPDGTMTLRGYAGMPAAIRSIEVRVGGYPVEPVVASSKGEHSAGAEDLCGGQFEVTFPLRPEQFGKAAEVRVTDADGAAATSTFPAGYDLPASMDEEVRLALLAPQRGVLEHRIARSGPIRENADDVLFRGWTLSAEPITEVAAYVGGERLTDVMYPTFRPDVGRVHPQYLQPHSGFEIRVPDEPKYVEGPMRIVVRSGEKVLIERVFRTAAHPPAADAVLPEETSD